MAASELLQKSRTRILAQANGTALTANLDPNSGSYTGDTPSLITNTIGATNGNGSSALNLEINVTSAPATDAVCQIWWRGYEVASDYTKWKYSHTVGEDVLSASVDRYDAGMFMMDYQFVELAVVSDVALNATLCATPKLIEAQ